MVQHKHIGNKALKMKPKKMDDQFYLEGISQTVALEKIEIPESVFLVMWYIFVVRQWRLNQN
jgi:hypothetical protein